MSRWTEQFENHMLHDFGGQFQYALEQLPSRKGMAAEDAAETARLKKVIAYIDELLASIDPELMPESFFDTLSQQAEHALNQIKTYNSNEAIAHIQKAQKHLDEILKIILPYGQKGKQAQAAGRALSSYAKSIESSFSKVADLEKEALDELEQRRTEAENYVEQIKEYEGKISALDSKLFEGPEGDAGVSDKIDEFHTAISEKYDEILSFHSELTSGDEEESAIIQQIRELRDEIADVSKEVSAKLESAEISIEELEAFHKKIFGTRDKAGNYSGGLRDELNQRKADLDKFKETQEKKYKSLVEEIDSLLPGAISAGLATAYKDLKESFEQPIIINTRIFYASLIGIVIAMFFLITENISWTAIEFISADEPINIIENILYKLPLLVPLIWLAFFASKRRSEYSRLEQEYAHKEALAKSYKSFKEQVDALQSGNDELKELLLASSIKAIALNASETLDGSHKSESPIEKTTDAFAERVAKLLKKGETNDQ